MTNKIDAFEPLALKACEGLALAVDFLRELAVDTDITDALAAEVLVAADVFDQIIVAIALQALEIRSR